MEKFKNFEEYSSITINAQKNKLNNINCYLMPNEIIDLIKDEKLSYLKNENTLQLICESDRYVKVYFYGNSNFTFIPFKTTKTIITDLPFMKQKTDKFITSQEKFEKLGFKYNSSVTRAYRDISEEYEILNNDYIIEKANLKNIDEIFEIWEENFDEIENLLYSKNEIIKNIDNIYVLKDNTQNLLGALELVIEKNNAWIQKIAVKKTYQGKGLGGLLEKFCINKCKSLGIKKILLYTIDTNENAQAFHKKFGFQPDGKINYQFVKGE